MDYVCPSIRTWLHHHSSHLDILKDTREVGPTRCSVKIAVPSTSTSIDLQEYDLKKVMAYVWVAVEWVVGLYWSRPIETLDIHIWLTPIPKIFCYDLHKTNLVGKCEVNSGETAFLSHKRRNVSVWRREDWSKVLLHELLHAFDWDRLVPSTPDNQSEALVETMAIILHSQLLGGPQWNIILEKEREWAWNQVLTLSRIPWRPQQTSVHSYYILKTALLFNLSAFARLIRKTDFSKNEWTLFVGGALADMQRRVQQYSKLDLARNGCVSMRMALHQLSLRPHPI